MLLMQQQYNSFIELAKIFLWSKNIVNSWARTQQKKNIFHKSYKVLEFHILQEFGI